MQDLHIVKYSRDSIANFNSKYVSYNVEQQQMISYVDTNAFHSIIQILQEINEKFKVLAAIHQYS